jgi:hypothetical protein
MEPVTTAFGFSTIVGLVCNFKSEKSGKNFDEFLNWLKEKNQENVIEIIQNNRELSDGLCTLFQANHEVVLEKLKNLDHLVSSLAGRIDIFANISKSITNDSLFSDQAISILTQFTNSGAKLFMEKKMRTGAPDQYILLDGAHGQIEYTEPRFIEDDLNALVASGLLRLEFGGKGSRQYFITRNAIEFTNEINR